METKARVKWMRTLGNASYMIGVALLIAAMAYTAAPVKRAAAQAAGKPDPADAFHRPVVACGDSIAGEYNRGDTVFVQGWQFQGNADFTGSIFGFDGGGSCDPGSTVATFNGTTDGSGNFCVNAYTVANDDCGQYYIRVIQGPYNLLASYRVKVPPPTAVPPATSTTTAGGGGSGGGDLIPVAGAALGGGWRTSTILFNLGIGFLGLGLVLNGLARTRKDLDL